MKNSASLRDSLNPLARTSILHGLLVLALAGLLVLAWRNRFVQDDAYISFRYAYNLAHGNGLVWNVGERVEGYTNFLWTILMSVPIFFGHDPIGFSFVLGLTFYFLTLLLTYKTAADLLASQTSALFVVILLGTNYTFSSYATGGLETPLHTCLIAAAVYLALIDTKHEIWKVPRSLLLSVLAGLAVLTRPDSPALLSVILLFAAVEASKTATSFRQGLLTLGGLILPLTIIVGGWLILKTRYYGEVLPNTFYAKVSPSLSLLQQGVRYLYIFVESYFLIPFILLLAVYARRLADRSNARLTVLALMIVLWLVYTVSVGGDFMEFRLLVPILPAVSILIGWLIFVQITPRRLTAALFVMILFGSLHHALSFHGWANITSLQELADQVDDTNDSWATVGRILGEAFNHDPRVTIAVPAVGAVSYYSRLRVIDMHGINDRWVARHGTTFNPSMPGHLKLATWNYLREREVNLIVDLNIADQSFKTDLMTDTPAAFGYLKIVGANPYKVAQELKIVEVNLGAKHRLFLGYVTRNLAVDEAIRRNGWREYLFNPIRAEMRNRPSIPTYQPGTRLDFAAAETVKYLWYGWGARELDHRWTNRPQAAMLFRLEKVVACVLRIDLQPFLPAPNAGQRVRIQLNGAEVAVWNLNTAGFKTYAVLLPANLLRKENTLSFALPDAVSPKEIGAGAALDLLALNVRWLQIDEQFESR